MFTLVFSMHDTIFGLIKFPILLVFFSINVNLSHEGVLQQLLKVKWVDKGQKIFLYSQN